MSYTVIDRDQKANYQIRITELESGKSRMISIREEKKDLDAIHVEFKNLLKKNRR